MKNSKTKSRIKTKRPSRQLKKLLNIGIYFFAITTPMFELIQALRIYTEKSSSDVSLLAWSYFLVDNIVWLIYGYVYKQKPILIMYMLYTTSELIVVAMILFYR